jgi:hypothetical protein
MLRIAGWLEKKTIRPIGDKPICYQLTNPEEILSLEAGFSTISLSALDMTV